MEAPTLFGKGIARKPLSIDVMRFFGVSNRGLIVNGILVAVLWGLIYTERALTRRAQLDYLEVMRSLARIPVKTDRRCRRVQPGIAKGLRQSHPKSSNRRQQRLLPGCYVLPAGSANFFSVSEFLNKGVGV